MDFTAFPLIWGLCWMIYNDFLLLFNADIEALNNTHMVPIVCHWFPCVFQMPSMFFYKFSLYIHCDSMSFVWLSVTDFADLQCLSTMSLISMFLHFCRGYQSSLVVLWLQSFHLFPKVFSIISNSFTDCQCFQQFSRICILLFSISFGL